MELPLGQISGNHVT